MPWAEGSAKPLSHPGCPTFLNEWESVFISILWENLYKIGVMFLKHLEEFIGKAILPWAFPLGEVLFLFLLFFK